MLASTAVARGFRSMAFKAARARAQALGVAYDADVVRHDGAQPRDGVGAGFGIDGAGPATFFGTTKCPAVATGMRST